MKTKIQIFSILFVFLVACNNNPNSEQKETPVSKFPNFIVIVADDLGYSDLGAFGGEINTPVLNALAKEGIQFTNFHVLPTCSPTRSSLMSGNDNHVAGLGVMSETIYPAIKDLPGYAGHLSKQVATLPEVLATGGYNTYMSGKWHLGETDDQSPFARGFQETFSFAEGAASHWSDMRALGAETSVTYRRNGMPVATLPEDFYSTKNYTDSIIHFIDKNKTDEKPFLAYLSFTAPHDPLHAPAEYIAKYKGRYDQGWDELRNERVKGLLEKGIISEDVAQEELSQNVMVQPWATLDEQSKKEKTRDMEVYAAMVDYIDASVGRLTDYLKANNLYDNTIILFFSDNGANGAPATAYPGNADGQYLSTFNNELENRGLPNSFIDMGAGWAQASSANFRLFKSFTSEGGIKSPLIVKPLSKSAKQGLNTSLLHVSDIMPTLLDYAGIAYPKEVNGTPVKTPIGESFKTVLNGGETHKQRNKGIGYELFEMKAYIEGDWKILRLVAPFGNGDWQLYNLAEDPSELNDLSATNPEKRMELIDAYQAYAKENEVFDHQGLFDGFFKQAYGVDE
ncbi:arylsulfatase [Reichenbachiella carrageenanivorans]|uniref:Arylsulfatase n=1 Tax=Reichenbachiella carrageenanivorans TaxID=2979869 RepID=A0ABY6CVE1_9BACT|nr:arylsulfatase [Reichenbachiella carrageenanivorans]UXX77882.1 arylsulfatase [Reichenbachiella carrageenanivorans]